MYKLQYERRKPRSLHDKVTTLVQIAHIAIVALMVCGILVFLYLLLIVLDGFGEFSKWGMGR